MTLAKNSRFIIMGNGGKKNLNGSIMVKGAKNAALKLFAASLLFEDCLTIKNVPYIEDILRMKELLEGLGANIKNSGEGSYVIQAPMHVLGDPRADIFARLRASVTLIGPLLGRFGRVSFVSPGGDAIGKRPIDVFLEGFRKMGATLYEKEASYDTKKRIFEITGKLHGAEIFQKVPSVTATETLLMAAILADGTTVLKNSAMEPEVVSLASYLALCGADIYGIGTPTLIVKGRNGKALLSQGLPYETIPDRIEAGSFIILGALAATDLTIHGCDTSHLDSLLYHIEKAGILFDVSAQSVHIKGNMNNVCNPFSVKTHEYPGFPTDLQPLIVLLLTQANGGSSVLETIYESRLEYIETLNRMEARITANNNEILIVGPTPLSGMSMEGKDIRSGMAFIMAAIIAEGTSVVHNAYNVDRGYERIEERLAKVGVSIKRVEASKLESL